MVKFYFINIIKSCYIHEILLIYLKYSENEITFKKGLTLQIFYNLIRRKMRVQRRLPDFRGIKRCEKHNPEQITSNIQNSTNSWLPSNLLDNMIIFRNVTSALKKEKAKSLKISGVIKVNVFE